MRHVSLTRWLPLRATVNYSLDRAVRAQGPLGLNVRSAFRACAAVGSVLFIGAGLCAAYVLDLSVWLVLAITAASVAACYGVSILTKSMIGSERYVWYHLQLAVNLVSACVVGGAGQPVLPYLDIVALASCLFLACGRIGCLLVGCCHGRPFRWGIRYDAGHAACGFTPYYVGVTLFPVQALESIWALFIVVVGSAMIIRSSAPGSALTWYVIVYGVGRFSFEFLRGDLDRPYFYGFSEAQWTSLILMSLTVCSEASRLLPWQAWHLLATAGVAVTMAAVALHRHFCRVPAHRLLHPRHIGEIAEALELAVPREGPPEPSPWIRVGCTSLGIRISGCDRRQQGSALWHYTLSSSGQALTYDEARVLAAIICNLRHATSDFDLLRGRQDVFHCVASRRRDIGERSWSRSHSRIGETKSPKTCW